jgi:hypothetical protein
MPGDDRRRFCGDCGLHVHNFAAMTAEEAEAFLRDHLPKGRVCGVLYRRADGTVLTRDCPVGVARWRRAAAWSLAKMGAAAAFVLCAATLARPEQRLRTLQPFRSVCEWLNPSAPPPPGPLPFLGEIACPVPAPPTPAPPASTP